VIRIVRFGDLYRCFSTSKVPRKASVKTNSLVYSSSASMSVGSPASSGGGGGHARGASRLLQRLMIFSVLKLCFVRFSTFR
jgi:hypothetical protein